LLGKQDEERRQMKLWKEHKNKAMTQEQASAGQAISRAIESGMVWCCSKQEASF